MTDASRQFIISRLWAHVQEVRSYTDGLSPEQLKERPSVDQLSLHEIVMHLVGDQDMYIERVAHMLEEEHAELVPLNGASEVNESYVALNFNEGIRSYVEQRKTLISLLKTLDDRQWRKEGKHPHAPNYTVEKCMESLMRHEEHHLYEMFNVFFGVKE
ncbi:MAG: DinB family protein [Bacteroidota bacterium]